jgi:hypothetical protein
MATKKQRRRQEKNRRHEWEEVWVDDEGQEVEPPPEAEQATPRKAEAAKARPARGSRATREVPPPSLERALRRAAMFMPLVVIVVYLLQKPADRTVTKLATTTALLVVFFVPFSYIMDRVMYRAFLKRTGKQPSPPAKKRD